MKSIERLLAPLYRRIRLLINRAVVTRSDASQLMQSLQLSVLSEETVDGIEHFEPYGFTSRPQEGAEALLGSIGGRRNNALCFMVSDRRFRVMNLAKGEVALFTDEGDVIHFQRGNTILINSASQVTVTAPTVVINASTQVDINSPIVNISGVLNVVGNINGAAQVSDASGSMGTMRADYNAHAGHNAPGTTPDHLM